MNEIKGLTELENFFSTLEHEAREKVLFATAKAGGKALQEDTRRQLVKQMGSSATTPVPRMRGGKITTLKPMEKGVTNKLDKAYGEVRVSILGDFRLKWFEMGTKERKLLRTGAKDHDRGRVKGDRRFLYRKQGKASMYRRGESRGKIRALHFFRTARENEGAVTAAMEQEFEKTISRFLK